MTRDSRAEVAGGDPRLARLEQGDRVGGLVGQLEDVRLELLEQVLGLGDLVGGHAVGIAHPGELAHVGHDLDRLVLHDDPLLVLRVEEDLPRSRGPGRPSPGRSRSGPATSRTGSRGSLPASSRSGTSGRSSRAGFATLSELMSHASMRPASK